MENQHIADSFSLLSKLMDIHGENSFNNPSGEPRLTQVFFMRKCETKELPPIQRSRNI